MLHKKPSFFRWQRNGQRTSTMIRSPNTFGTVQYEWTVLYCGGYRLQSQHCIKGSKDQNMALATSAPYVPRHESSHGGCHTTFPPHQLSHFAKRYPKYDRERRQEERRAGNTNGELLESSLRATEQTSRCTPRQHQYECPERRKKDEHKTIQNAPTKIPRKVSRKKHPEGYPCRHSYINFTHIFRWIS